jgi:hypothetical protein
VSSSVEIGSPSYAILASARPSSPAVSVNAGANRSIAATRACTSAAPSVTTDSVQGERASSDDRPARTRRSPALRCPSADAYSLAIAARAGRSRPTTRSMYARRVAGPPFTTASRSGVNTSVVSSLRSRSLEVRRSPFSSTRRTSPRVSVTSVANLFSPRAPASRTRAASASKRIMSLSRRARGENACVPTWSASRRFVLPAPFGPWSSTTPGSRLSSSEAYERKSRSRTSRTISPRAGWA